MAHRSNPAKELDQLLSKIRERVEPDITIRCGSDEHSVHSFLLEDMSSFFDKVCNGPFKEHRIREVDLVEDDPVSVKAFVDLLYEGDYATKPDDNNVLTKWRHHTRVYYFAIKYEIKALAKQASRKFAAAVPTRSIHTIHAGLIADLVRFAYSFGTLENRPDSIRSAVCAMFLSQKRFLEDKGVLQAIAQHPEFSRDLVFTWRDWASMGDQVQVPCAQSCGGYLKCIITCNKCSLGGEDKEAPTPAPRQGLGEQTLSMMLNRSRV